jgi:hypothetical protein
MLCTHFSQGNDKDYTCDKHCHPTNEGKQGKHNQCIANWNKKHNLEQGKSSQPAKFSDLQNFFLTYRSLTTSMEFCFKIQMLHVFCHEYMLENNSYYEYKLILLYFIYLWFI